MVPVQCLVYIPISIWRCPLYNQSKLYNYYTSNLFLFICIYNVYFNNFIIYSSSHEKEEGKGVYGVFGSKLGYGATKVGKKVAQSEAGRSATRSAIKGTSEAATKDLTDRYLGEYPPAPVKGKTSSITPTSKPSGSLPTQTTSAPKVTVVQDDSNREFERLRLESYSGSRHNPHRNLQKPCLLRRLKPNISLKSSNKEQPKPRSVRTSERKVYKYVLSKEAEWERLPQAITLYNFRAEMKCDLEFRKGQIIFVMTRTDTQDDWWEGKIEDRVGIFPANYVRML